MYRFPLDALDLLGSLRGQVLEAIVRQLYREDAERYPPGIRDQESDGPVELRFGQRSPIHFVPDAESSGIQVAEGPMPRYGEVFLPPAVCCSAFFQARTGSAIRRVRVVPAIDARLVNPGDRGALGVEIELEAGASFVIRYLSDESHVDSLVVQDVLPPTAPRIEVSQHAA